MSRGLVFFIQFEYGIGGTEMSGKDKKSRNEEYLSIIRDAVSQIQYGTVTISIQDGVIVQVERSERYRLKSEQAGGRSQKV